MTIDKRLKNLEQATGKDKAGHVEFVTVWMDENSDVKQKREFLTHDEFRRLYPRTEKGSITVDWSVDGSPKM